MLGSPGTPPPTAARGTRTAAWALLGLAMAVAVFLYLYWGRNETFFADEWNFMVNRRHWDGQTLFYPQAGHLSIVPVLVYKLLFTTIGAEHYLPFRLVAVAMTLVVALLLYVLLRRRVGDWVALGPVVLVLFLGSSWEVLMASYGLNVLIGLAAGLGMLLCLDRGDLRGDLGACALLALSLASFSIGVVFAVAAAVELLIARAGTPLRRAWVFLLPLALYAAWLLWARQFDQSTLSASNIDNLPRSVAESLGALAGSVSGLFRNPADPPAGELPLGVYPVYGAPIAIAIGAATAVRLWLGPSPGPRLWALLAMFAAYWGLIALSLDAARAANSPRYMLPGAVLLFLLLAEAFRGIRFGRGWAIAGAAVLAFAIVSNAQRLHTGGEFFRTEANYNRAALGALDLAATRVDPLFRPEPGTTKQLPHGDLYFYAFEYLSAAADYGNPAYSEEEIVRAPEYARAYADRELIRALPVRVKRGPRSQSTSNEQRATSNESPPSHLGVDHVVNGTTMRRGRCVILRPVPGDRGQLDVIAPTGGFALRAGPGPGTELELRRFASRFGAWGMLVPGSESVRIPSDLSPRRWRAAVSSTTPVSVCG